MNDLTEARPIKASLRVPGDKAISHRAALLAVLAEGRTTIRSFSPAGDCEATLRVLRALGVRHGRDGEDLWVEGVGGEWRGAHPPEGHIDCGRSGTTMRLAAGLLAAAPGTSVLTGHPQLLRRPMERVAEPLRSMGADVRSEGGGGTAPLTITGGPLRGIRYRLPVASAQVKSAVLFAGIQADGTTSVIETIPTRDHSERMLSAMGAGVRVTTVDGGAEIALERSALRPLELLVPGDFSSAAPLIAAAALLRGSDLSVRGVGLNPTRTGLLRVLGRMGGDFIAETAGSHPEPWGEVRVRHQPLAATAVRPEEVPSLIDELPLVGVLATQAGGTTEVRGAAELRLKESDRIGGLVEGLRALGAEAEALEDGFVVTGPTPLRGGRCDALDDHRLAMAFAVAALVASGRVEVKGMGFVGDSFPGFIESLEALR